MYPVKPMTKQTSTNESKLVAGLFAALVAMMSMTVVAEEEPHEDHQNHHDAHSDEEPHVKISPDMAQTVGITIQPAAAGIIQRRIRVFGDLVVAPDQRSEVRARFPGLVTAVNVNVGDRVGRGQVLATVESNQSLQDYSVEAPIDGVVQHRHANPGEVAGETPLFVLLDSTSLWAELKIFPGRRGDVAVGQSARIESDHRSAEAAIEHLVPADDGEPFSIARLRVDNADGIWLPGDRVVARILVERVEVPLVVDNRALQQIDGETVVFVRSGDRFEPRPVELGRRDDRRTEVLSGLSAGESYVVENSYLIKADLEKSGAGHQH